MKTRSGTAVSGEGVEIFYEDLGDPADPAVLLIMGVGAQLPMWPNGFCELLLQRGFRVIRFDHRDIGLSTKLSGQKADGSVYARVVRYALGRRSPVALHARRHGRGRPRTPRPSPDRPGARRRSVDGRDDRPDPGGQSSGAGQLAGAVDDQFRQAVVGAAALAGDQAGVRSPGQGRSDRGQACVRGPATSR